MKKKFLKYLKEMQKSLDSRQLDEAFELIKNSVEQMEDKPIEKPLGEFVVPETVQAKQGVVIYSDGACRGNPGPGAYGCMAQNATGEILFEKAQAFELTTNNKMEMLGVIEGLKKIKQDGRQNDFVLVVTDSKYVVNGMKSWVAGWKARGWKKADKKVPENVELWQELDQLNQEFSSLDFEWVKGHSGHPQNEHCDQLANKILDDEGY